MVQTRRSLSKSPMSSLKESTPKRTPPTTKTAITAATTTTTTTTTSSSSSSSSSSNNKNKKKSTNETKTISPRRSSRRQQTQNILRLQATGLGISIDTTTTTTATTPKKIVFDQDGNLPIQQPQQHQQQEQISTNRVETIPTIESMKDIDTSNNKNIPDDHDHDHDDDVIEEVKGSDAKIQIQEQQIVERSTARESTLIRGIQKKRKRKSKIQNHTTTIISKEDEFDEDFFQELDTQMEQEKQRNKEQKKMKKDLQSSKGKLITFVAHDEESTSHNIMKKDHNIQVVVLKENSVQSSGLSVVAAPPPLPLPSLSIGKGRVQVTSSYSKFQIQNGKDELSSKQLQKNKKTGRKVEETWKRSKQTTQMILGRQQQQQQHRRRHPPNNKNSTITGNVQSSETTPSIVVRL